MTRFLRRYSFMQSTKEITYIKLQYILIRYWYCGCKILATFQIILWPWLLTFSLILVADSVSLWTMLPCQFMSKIIIIMNFIWMCIYDDEHVFTEQVASWLRYCITSRPDGTYMLHRYMHVHVYFQVIVQLDRLKATVMRIWILTFKMNYAGNKLNRNREWLRVIGNDTCNVIKYT